MTASENRNAFSRNAWPGWTSERVEGVLAANLRDFAESLEERLSHLDGKLDSDVTAGASLADETRTAVRELAERVADLDNRLTQSVGGDLYEKLGELKERIAGVAETFVDRAVTPDAIQAVRQELKATHTDLLQRLDEYRTAQQAELRTLLTPADNEQSTTVEVNIDELADRLVAGVRNHGKFLDTETGAAVDAMARLAEGLVKEQANNTERLDRLAAEIHNASAGLAQLDEWRGELPERVADEIGRTVEARVVGPISGALARQAPSILSDLQDNKLVDIVSRSVREAQRPLLREILAGGRQGVPVWLFASVLLPLLLILGYLFLPGDLIGVDVGRAPVTDEVADALVRIETAGVPLAPDTEDRLRNIEDAVLDIHSEALVHVKNAAGLEEEVKSLKATLAERDRLIRDYNETLQNQVKRIREYEMRLVQLGVSPTSIGEN
ncbi:MAG: hypothetical protein LUG50_03395 [Planctomycetaceae bacterium]|nr:hypothetical protein [Planctomycetaceae bacterium]